MPAIMIERSIVVKAERSRVWRAITTPESMVKWFQPVHFEHLVEGSAMTFAGGAQGSIVIVEPMERFGFRGQIAPPHPAQTLVIFALATVPEGTRVTVTEQGFEALPDEVRASRFKDNMQGWERVLNSLSTYLTSKEP